MPSSQNNLTPNKKGDAKDGRKSPMATFATTLANQIQPAVKSTWEEGVLFRRPKEWLTPLVNNEYHYKPLPTSSCIRLLRIEPGSPGERIRCSLHTVDLNARPKYIALSYSWRRDKSLSSWVSDIPKGMFKNMTKAVLGNSKRISQPNTDEGAETTQTILCDGKSMTVYPNLYNALLQFRQSAPGDYWIDAVCIHQADLVERTSQVQMMGRIYSSAETVTIWLGTCPQILSTGIAQLEESKDNLLRPGGREQKSDKQSLDNEVYLAAGYLLLRRYFRRLWVLQEACLGKVITFQLGEQRISPNTFLAAINLVSGGHSGSENDQILIRGLANFLRPWSGHISLIPAMLEGRENFHQGFKWSLEQWLKISRGRKTTDPRDFVNAGLALIKPETLYIDQSILLDVSPATRQSRLQGPDTKRKLWPRLHADYVAEAPEVFLNLAACLLSQPNETNLLSIASRPNDYKAVNYAINYSVIQDREKIRALLHVPSWVPIPGSLASQTADTFATQGGAHFAACTNLKSNPKISPDGKTLFMDASRLGTIEHVCTTKYLLPDDVNEMTDFLEFITKIPRKYSPSGQWGLSAFAHVLVGGVWGAEHPPPRETVTGLVTFLDDDVRKYTRKLDKDIKELQDTNIRNRLVNQGVRLMTKTNESIGSLQQKKERLQKAYADVKDAYPNQHWPDPKKKIGPEAAELKERFELSTTSALSWRNTFLTREGYLGLGPWSLAKGDVVMLVNGGYVPYAFTPVREDRRKRAEYIEERMQVRIKAVKVLPVEEREFLESELAYVRSDVRSGDDWVLVGETYVQGVMMGEAVNDTTALERIAIV
ncbi:heterokaryon incompatibility protein-domain-containing protein [Whalleya microplaca]|nr:heterokaryon incompatibility protein-domain-containing protein [Whalleya microplaca]